MVTVRWDGSFVRFLCQVQYLGGSGTRDGVVDGYVNLHNTQDCPLEYFPGGYSVWFKWTWLDLEIVFHFLMAGVGGISRVCGWCIEIYVGSLDGIILRRSGVPSTSCPHPLL